MEAMREHWTDDRMDDLAKRMDDGFKRVDANFDRVNADLRALRADVTEEIRALRVEMGARFATNDVQFAALQRQLAQIGWGAVGTFAAALIALIATKL